MWNFLIPLAVPLAKLIMLLIDKSEIAAAAKKEATAQLQSVIDLMENARSMPPKLRKDVEDQNVDLDSK